MATNKLFFAMLIAGSQLLTAADARISDLPASNIWGSQWGTLAGSSRLERLPCLRADKGACSRAFSSSVTGSRRTRKAGSIDPFARPAHTVRTAKQRVVYKNATRIRATTRRAGFNQANDVAPRGVLPNLLLSDSGAGLLDVSLDQSEVVQPAAVETLAEYVSTVGADPPADSALLNDATGGLGNNAYVSLYDFDDGTTVSSGETSGGFKEITSLLDANSTRAATSIPEPRTCLLLGAGLLIWRIRGRKLKLRWGGTAHAQA